MNCPVTVLPRYSLTTSVRMTSVLPVRSDRRVALLAESVFVPASSMRKPTRVGFTARRANEHHLRGVHRQPRPRRCRPGGHAAFDVLADDVDAFDDHLVLTRHVLAHAAPLSFISSPQNDDFVPGHNLLCHSWFSLSLLQLMSCAACSDCLSDRYVESGHLSLQRFRGQRHNAHKLALAQLTGNRSKDARSARIALRIDQYRRVIIEADMRTIGRPYSASRAHNHGPRRHRPS